MVPLDSFLRSKNQRRKYVHVERDNKRLKARILELEEAGRENSRLRSLLAFQKRTTFESVAAKVIAFDASNFSRSFVINKGQQQGIKIGNPVITPDGVVGIIQEVSKTNSRVLLINNPEFAMAAEVPRSHAAGVVSGMLDGQSKLKYLELDADVRIGDDVISIGRNSRFPGGIPIGIVSKILKDPTGLMLSAILTLEVQLSSLQEVLVIVNY